MSYHVEDNQTGRRASKDFESFGHAEATCGSLNNLPGSGGRYGIYNDRGERRNEPDPERIASSVRWQLTGAEIEAALRAGAELWNESGDPEDILSKPQKDALEKVRLLMRGDAPWE